MLEWWLLSGKAFKGVVHFTIKMLFTHPHVIQDVLVFISSVEAL